MIAIAAVVVTFYPPIAAIFLVMGLSLLLRDAYLDRKCGKDRPSRNEIDVMSVDDYKKRTRNDSRLTTWINHVYKNRTDKPFDPSDY